MLSRLDKQFNGRVGVMLCVGVSVSAPDVRCGALFCVPTVAETPIDVSACVLYEPHSF